jgi:hypothetical protein
LSTAISIQAIELRSVSATVAQVDPELVFKRSWERGFIFRAFVDPLGTSKFASVPGDVTIDFVPGPPAALSIVTPRLAQAGPDVPVRVRAFDSWGNCCTGLDESVEIQLKNGGDVAEELTAHAFPETGWAVVKLDVSTAGREGEIEFIARLPGLPRVAAARALLRIDHALATARAWFADLHVHSEDTVGINNTEYNLTYGRDVAGLDVLGYTANDFNITESNWNKAVELIHGLHTEGEFVSFPGTEWCGNSCAGGDHNVIFLHGRKPDFPFTQNGKSARSFEWNAEMKVATIQPSIWPLENLWDAYGNDPDGHLLIPHTIRRSSASSKSAPRGATSPGSIRMPSRAVTSSARRQPATSTADAAAAARRERLSSA